MEADLIYALEYASINIQRIVRGYQGRQYAVLTRLQKEAASTIQQMFRCHRARTLGKRIIVSADLLTRWARTSLYKMKLNILRRKVLHRWGRRRHLILFKIMSVWPGYTNVGTRRMKIVKLGQAKRHYKLSVKRKAIQALKQFVVIQKHTKEMYEKAMKWWRKAELSKAWRTYKENVLDIIETRRKLLNAIAWWNKRTMIRGYLQWKKYHEWRQYRTQQYVDAAVRLIVLRKKRVFQEFKNAVEERRIAIMKAAQWFFSTKQRQSWIQWKKYLDHRQRHHERMALAIEHAAESRPYYREMTGVKRWVRWWNQQKENLKRYKRAIGLWQNRKKGSAFRSWQLLVRLQQADRKAEKYWNEKNSSETVIEWHEWAVNQKVWRKRLAIASKKAAKHFRARKWAPAFLQWKAVWSKANYERIELQKKSAATINRVGRGYMSRRLARAKRRINELMRPLKIAREEAVKYTNAMVRFFGVSFFSFFFSLCSFFKINILLFLLCSFYAPIFFLSFCFLTSCLLVLFSSCLFFFFFSF